MDWCCWWPPCRASFCPRPSPFYCSRRKSCCNHNSWQGQRRLAASRPQSKPSSSRCSRSTSAQVLGICNADQGSTGDRSHGHSEVRGQTGRGWTDLSDHRYNDRDVYPRIIQPSLLKALKSVSQYELVTIATEWNDISALVERTVAEELTKFDYVEVRGLDLTGLQIAEEYRAAIEQKQIAEQQLLRAQTEVKIAEQEAIRYDTLNRSLDDQVLFKLFLDKWDGRTEVVPALPGTAGGTPPVIVGRRS